MQIGSSANLVLVCLELFRHWFTFFKLWNEIKSQKILNVLSDIINNHLLTIGKINHQILGIRIVWKHKLWHKISTLWSQIEENTRLLILWKFSILPAVIWAYPFINFQENFQPPCFFTYTNEIFSTLPAVNRAYPLIKFEEKFQPTLSIEPPLVLET